MVNYGYEWEFVVFFEGWYYIYGYVDDGYGILNKSNIFSVIEGLNISCLVVYESMSKIVIVMG